MLAEAPEEIPLDNTAPAEASVADGPCAQASPPGQRVEIDDFEDNDAKIFKVFEREGWWFTAADETEAQKLFPPRGSFAASPLPEEEASKDNAFAAHLSAAGQTDWGVVWGATLKWTRKGIGCPFNASPFAGVEFRAKGPATIWVNFPTPDTTPAQEGGKCKDKCWDSYGKVVRIKEGWDSYTVRWDQLQQEGWGTDVRFDSERVLNLNFSAKVAYLPVDFWVDDIKFIAKNGTPASAAPAGRAASAAAEVPGKE
jgi:hypothetical protein